MRQAKGMDWKSHVTRDPKVLVGKPTIRGTRISVELVVGLLAQVWPESDILESYPKISKEDIQACLLHAAELVKAEMAHPIVA
jgi:uncharacterized protein (DUF433 family)